MASSSESGEPPPTGREREALAVLLSQPCSDQHLNQFSQFDLGDWREMIPHLGLLDSDKQSIIEYSPRSVSVQEHVRVTRMLMLWKERYGTAATYGRLCDAFQQSGRQYLADSVEGLLLAEYTNIQSLWDQPCSDKHLQYISQFSIDLRLISPALGLTDIDELPVQVSVGTQISPFPDQAQNLEILRMWCGKFGSIASYRKLADVLREHGRQDLVDRISELVTAAGETSVTLSPDGCLSSAGAASSIIISHSKRSLHHSPSTSLYYPHPRRSRLNESFNTLMAAPLSPPCSLHHSPSTSLYYPPPLSPPATLSSTSLSAQLSQLPLSPYLQQYVQHLKNRYISIDTPVFDKEQGLLQAKAKSFVNIALVHKHSLKYMIDSDKKEMLMDRLHGHVDAIQKKKTKLCIHDVCKSQDGRLARCVLVEGAPGVGKTTFVFELCKRWARGEILQEFSLVFTIKLRDHRTRTAMNMYDLLYHPRPEVKQAVVDELIEQDGKNMLLIFDGYDELTDSQRDIHSVIQCLMSRELLCRSTLMVTSRPLATRTLHNNFVQSIDQHIEVLGFTEKNIEEYIQSACGDKPELVEDFKSYLSSHPFSSALMFNPLQCAIVTDLYCCHWEHGDKGFAPKTLTELYTGLLHILLLRYLTHHPVYTRKVHKLNDLSDLPMEVSHQLQSITELAADGIENQQYVFEDNVPMETLGLMQVEEEVIPAYGRSESYYFLNLTLQEYLAAVNYSKQCSSPEQLSQLLTRDDLFPLSNFLESYGKKRKHSIISSATHWSVVLFIAGRTKLDGVSPNILRAGIEHNVLKEIKRQRKLHETMPFPLTDYSEVKVSLLHLLYETQSPQLIRSTLVTSRKYLSVSGSSALDWFVIGYCIANSTSTWRVEKKGNDSPEYFDQLIMGLCLGPEDCSGEYKIGSLHISGHWTGNWKILTQFQPYAKSLTEMNLIGPRRKALHSETKRKVVDEEVSACYPMLEKLAIKNAESGFSTSIFCFISQQNSLHTLSLKGCNLSSDFISSLIHRLQSVDNSLLELILDECIPDHSLTMSGSSILQLQLRGNSKVSLEFTGPCHDISLWLSQLSSYTQLTELIIHLTSQVNLTADTLQEILLYCDVLKYLKVNNSEPFLPLSIPQLIGSQLNSLHTLALSRCRFTSDVTRSLIHSLQSPHCKIFKLAIHECTISSTDHTQLVTAIVSSTTVTFLLFIDVLIDSRSLRALASGLKYNSTLEVLAIDKLANGFTEDQFRVLIDVVDSSTVKKLWLPTFYKQWLSDCSIYRSNFHIEWLHGSMDMLMLKEFPGGVCSSSLPLVQGLDEDETLQPVDTVMNPVEDEDETLQPVGTAMEKNPVAQNVMTADTECDKCKNRKSVYLTLDKRNEQLKKKDQVIIDLKQKLKDKEQECETYADKQTKDVVKSDEQADFIYKLKQEKQELKYEKDKVMEDMKRKNEQLESLLAENQYLKQHTQVQEKQVAELEQELKVKAKVMMNLCFDLDRKSDVEKRKRAQSQSDILFPISDDHHEPYVVGEKVFHIEGRAPQLLSWEEYGFRLRVQENITSGACDVTVKAIVAAGQIDLPEGCELVSAVYDISLSRKLTELITIEIEHCAKLENEAQCEYLSFVRARHNDQFKLIGGIFCSNTRYGALSCNCFCEIGIVDAKESCVQKPALLRMGKRKKSPQFSDEDQPSSKKICPNAEQHKFDDLDSEPEEAVSQTTSPDPTTINSAVVNGTDPVSAVNVSSGQQFRAERDCPPSTQYMARVFECYFQHKFLWYFVVYNNLQALDKYMKDFHLNKRMNESSQLIFCFTKDYLELGLEKDKEFQGWRITPYKHPCRVYEKDVKNNKSYYYKVVVKPDLKQVTQDLHYPVSVKHIDHDGETTVMIICDLSGCAPCTSIYSDTVTNCGQLSDFTDAGHHIVIPQSGSDIAGPSQSSEHIMVPTPTPDRGHGELVIRELMNKVAAPCMDQWELVGVQLDINDAQLNSIRSSYRTDQQRFKAVFDLWRRKGSPPYTWATIINVLKAPSVGEGKVAKDIMEWLSGGEKQNSQ